ncbi:MAG: histidine phosphatase family protein [candidate division SR1 bacterium]|nr:histidine phosphatase family protein [candidate division SR1 bacterium]
MNLSNIQSVIVIAVSHGEAESFDGFPNFHEEKKDRKLLTEAGKAQVKKLSEHFVIKGLKVDTIITSNFKRARQTAIILGDHLGIQKRYILSTDSLVEFNESEELVFQTSQDKAIFLASDRISSWFLSFVNNPLNNGKTILLVTHGLNIESMIRCATSIDDQIKVDPATYTEFIFKEGIICANLMNCKVD